MTETTTPILPREYDRLLLTAMATHNKVHNEWREHHEAGRFEEADAALMVAHDIVMLSHNLIIEAFQVDAQEGSEDAFVPAEDPMELLHELDAATFALSLRNYVLDRMMDEDEPIGEGSFAFDLEVDRDAETVTVTGVEELEPVEEKAEV